MAELEYCVRCGHIITMMEDPDDQCWKWVTKGDVHNWNCAPSDQPHLPSSVLKPRDASG